jgi:hypothetical protein
MLASSVVLLKVLHRVYQLLCTKDCALFNNQHMLMPACRPTNGKKNSSNPAKDNQTVGLNDDDHHTQVPAAMMQKLSRTEEKQSTDAQEFFCAAVNPRFLFTCYL